MPRPLAILVTGATGKQGGSVARILLGRGHRVRALTRDARSPAARELARLGAHLVEGDFDAPATLARAADDVDALFAVGAPREADPDAEARQGIALVNAARAAGVPHLLYTSIASANRMTGIPHFDSKWRIERHLAAAGVPHTVIAPVFLMENFVGRRVPELHARQLSLPLPATRRLQQISVLDVGLFAAHVLEQRGRFLGRRVELAADELTGNDVAQILGSAIGRSVAYRELPLERVRAVSRGRAAMYAWLDRVGFEVNVAALRRDFPALSWLRFEDWAWRQGLSLPESAVETRPRLG